MNARRAFFRQVGAMVALTALAKLAAFAKDVLLSLQFGAGPQTDAYFVANALPGFVFGGVFATIGMVFLPVYKRALFAGEATAATTYRTAVFAYIGLSLALGCATILAAPWLVSLVAPDMPSSTRDLATVMTRIMAFGFVFSAWVGLQNTILQSYKLLIWPQMVTLLNHGFAIGGLVVAALSEGPITLLVYAAVLGWVVTAPLIAARARAFWPKSLSARFDSRIALSLAALSFPVFLSMTLDQTGILIGTALGSSFPEGAVSHLNYASRLVVLLSSVFSMIIAYVLFPYLSESIVAHHTAKARRYVLQSLVAVLVLSMPLLIVCLTMSEGLIAFVFQRGAFGPDDSAETGRVLLFFAPLVILVGVREVLNRLFLSRQNTGILLLFGLLAVGVNLGASLFFTRRMGLEGIALGNTCGAAVYVVAQVVVLFARHRDILHRDLALWLAVIGGAASISALAGHMLATASVLESRGVDFLADAAIVSVLFGGLIAISVRVSRRAGAIYKKDDPV